MQERLILFFSNEDMDVIIRIIKSLENSGALNFFPEKILPLFIKKNTLKKVPLFFKKMFFLKFQKMELSSPKINKSLYFFKKSFSYISGNKTF